uniref:Uncharacterized protein n=1 Tax=Setaria italica TaxID=4555 RepID=K3YKN3_SETIT
MWPSLSCVLGRARADGTGDAGRGASRRCCCWCGENNTTPLAEGRGGGETGYIRRVGCGGRKHAAAW